MFSKGPWKSPFLREAPPGEAQSVQRGRDSTLHLPRGASCFQSL